MVQPSDRLSIGRAALWIVFSTLLISGSAAASWAYYQHLIASRALDPAFDITILVQTGPEREALRTEYLAELLDLSVDKPTNIYNFNVKASTQKLLSSPVIKDALVRTYNPGAVYVDYTIRRPIAYLGDYRNTAIDSEGFLFPCEPFFTPKKLPEVYVGLPPNLPSDEVWNTQISEGAFPVAIAVIDAVNNIIGPERCRIIKVDVSKAFAESYGQRQIVLQLEDIVSQNGILYYLPRTLRLSPSRYQESLKDYLILSDHLAKQLPVSDQPIYRGSPQVIDLRLPNLAYF
ncbi:MAG: hypothetical protein Q8K75_08070 [Chlamydiales bacterium]|nr:hypothetical protein [Chlamydiales bacterium]